MGSVRNCEDATEMIHPRDGGEPGCRFLGVRALGLCNNLVLRNAMSEEVVVTDAALRVERTSAATQSNDQGRQMLAIERQSVIETRSQHGRWTAVVFSRAEDRDGI